jgi:hypothetical protein
MTNNMTATQQTQATKPENEPLRLYRFSLYADWKCIFSVERAMDSEQAAEQLLQNFADAYNQRTNLFVVGNLEDITETVFND